MAKPTWNSRELKDSKVNADREMLLQAEQFTINGVVECSAGDLSLPGVDLISKIGPR